MTTPANSLNITQAGVVSFDGTATFTGSALTQHDVLVGGASNAIVSVAPSGTSGVPLISQGAASNPAFGTAVVAGGGTGNTTFTAFSVIAAGTTSTGAFQNVSGVGTTGQVLTSNGAATLPTWQAVPTVLFPWTDKAVSFAAAAANGYFVTATATATLPASPSQGNTIEFIVTTTGTATLTIQANTGQVIQLGTGASTTAGTAANNAQGDSIVLVYQAASTTWFGLDVIGTWTLA